MGDKKAQGKRITKRDCARLMGISDTSFANKFKRDTFGIDETTELLDKLGYDLIVKSKSKDSEIEYVVISGERIEETETGKEEVEEEKQKPNLENIMEMADKLGLTVVLKNENGAEFEVNSLLKADS